MAVILRYFTEFGQHAFLHITASICGGIHARLLYFVVRARCCRKESSRSLSHLLMSFLYKFCWCGWTALSIAVCCLYGCPYKQIAKCWLWMQVSTTVCGVLYAVADDFVLLAHSLNAIRQMQKYVMNSQLNLV